jgi:hypothetical protein
MYITEIIALTYFHRKPPAYDGSMYRSALIMLKYPPVLMMALGYWAVSNPQIFAGV